MRYLRIVLALLTALLLTAALAACGEGILPPKETEAATPAPMPTPTPTPTPTPFSGEVSSVEVLQAYDEAGALFVTEALVARRDTAVCVYLSSPLGHAPDERDSLTIGRGSELIGVFAADESSTADCLRFFLEGEDAEALTDGDYTFCLSVDGTQFNRRVELREARALRVLFVPVLGSFSGATSYPSEGWQPALEQLRREFPLANDGLEAVTAPGLTLTAEGFDLRTGGGLVRAWEALRERAGLLDGYDLIVGFVSGGMGESGSLGCFSRDGVALIDAAREDCGELLCRFAAQCFGVPEMQQGAACWQALRADFVKPRAEVEWADLLHVSGLLRPDGTVSLRPLYTGAGWGAGRTATPMSGGSYALVFADGDGTVLRREAFSPDFLWQIEGVSTADAAPIELTVGIPEGAATLRLYGPVQAGRGADGEAGEEAEAEETEAEEGAYTEGELYFADIPAEPYESSFTAVPNVEELRGTARVEWETVQTREEPAPEESEEDTEEDGEDETPPPPLPDPYYELYMCFDGVQLLVYRGGLRYAELDMPSLPKPENFFFRLLTCGGRTSTVTESPVLSME